MRLSVIIPCYNVADTLQRCVQSVLSQLPQDAEVILVDDGSTDATGLIVERIGVENVAVRVFHKSNGGLSDARNYGIAKACGEYLMFVDSDDEVVPSTFSSVLRFMIEHPQIDVAEFPIRVHCGHASEYLHDFPERIWTSAREYWLNSEAWEHTYAVNKIYKRASVRGYVVLPRAAVQRAKGSHAFLRLVSIPLERKGLNCQCRCRRLATVVRRADACGTIDENAYFLSSWLAFVSLHVVQAD